jgi:hypothetical protein
LLGT